MISDGMMMSHEVSELGAVSDNQNKVENDNQQQHPSVVIAPNAEMKNKKKSNGTKVRSEGNGSVAAAVNADVKNKKMMNVVNKIRRMNGEQYWGTSGNFLSQKPPRQLGEACSSNFCAKSALRNCSKFTEPIRKEIFDSFWKMSWDQKREFVKSLVNFESKKKSCSEASRRTKSITYYLKHNTRRLQVCREMFHSTLGVKEKMVRNWITQMKAQSDGIKQEKETSTPMPAIKDEKPIIMPSVNIMQQQHQQRIKQQLQAQLQQQLQQQQQQQQQQQSQALTTTNVKDDGPYKKMLNVNKLRRMKGEQYWSKSKNRLSQKPPRQLGEACKSRFCLKSALRNCSNFEEAARRDIFDTFWNMSWEQKRLYVKSLVSFSIQKIKSSKDSRRTKSITYFLHHDTGRLQVCREMFYATLGVKEKMVRNWINSREKRDLQLDDPLEMTQNCSL